MTARKKKDERDERLVQDSKHGDDVSVLWLGDELSERSDVVERSLGVDETHLAMNEAYETREKRSRYADRLGSVEGSERWLTDGSHLSRVVPGVLRSGNGV
jgi:hypothetical protein